MVLLFFGLSRSLHSLECSRNVVIVKIERWWSSPLIAVRANDSCLKQEFLCLQDSSPTSRDPLRWLETIRSSKQRSAALQQVPTIEHDLDLGTAPCIHPRRNGRGTRRDAVMGLLPVSSLQDLFQSYGLYALFGFVMLESMGIPVPGETMLIVAGLYAGSTHRIGIVPLVATATTAAVVGDNIGYLIGRAISIDTLRKYGRYIRLDERRIKIGRYLFRLQGGKLVFFGRFIAFLRIFCALLAGANRMSWSRFLVMNALGSLSWVTLVGGGSYVFGEKIERLTAPLGLLLLIIVALLTISGIFYFERYESALGKLAERTFPD
jgi:membrane protein DedA with SNARE-associated domain